MHASVDPEHVTTSQSLLRAVRNNVREYVVVCEEDALHCMEVTR